MLLAEVAAYYTDKLSQFGETPRGVDWNGEEGQSLRFEQLCQVITPGKPFSVNDLGCGYGALLDFLRRRYAEFSYMGIDVAHDMVRAANLRRGDLSDARFVVGTAPKEVADYGMASGIFNVRQQRDDEEWLAYLYRTLDVLHETSTKGFAFNCLTSYSDDDKKRDYLYYADPGALFDLCMRRYSRHVAVLHDYGLYEFTIIVRKSQ